MRDRLSSKIRKMLKLNLEYSHAGFAITLPPEHLLCTHQKQHRLYDKFLPHLTGYLQPTSTVIDVGANCGDTLAAMYDANNKLNYLCIEADERFYSFLEKNASRIREADAGASIVLFKALIGKNITNVTLHGSGGTKHAVAGGLPSNNQEGTMFSQTLDDLLSLTKSTNIRLLKSDVDGFDYDVIDSAESTIKSHLPLIFFESQCDEQYQKTGFQKTIGKLQALGYKDWVAFDNFGELILQTTEVEQLDQLLDYVWRQNVRRSTRTIYYFDILAVSPKDRQLLHTVLDAYKLI